MKVENRQGRDHRQFPRFLRSRCSILPESSSVLFRLGFGIPRSAGFLLLLLAFGCAPEARYRVLTIFFEGVPPPGAPTGAPGTAAAVLETRLAKPVSFHAAFREGRCADCHVDRQPPLKEAVPGLCWACHPRPEAARPWNHAPARAGDCMACHVGHETMMPHLLASQGKGLCYKCHKAEFMEKLPAHQGVAMEDCLKCHPYHEGGTRLPERPAGASVSEAPAGPRNPPAS